MKLPSLPRVVIVLPAYNEEQTVGGTIRAFHAQLPQAQVIVINNNSTDATREIAERVFQEEGINGKVIEEDRQGKGNALRRAVLDIDADLYVLADADLTYPADRVHDLMRPVLEGRAEMVVGDRHSGGHYAAENKRPLHNFGNRLVQHLVNVLFNASLVDIMSGYRVLSRSFVKTYPILVEGFQIETDMTLHALHRRLRIVEIPIAYRDRPQGSTSKLNTFTDGARVISTIAQILRYYRPLAFFLLMAILFAAAGLIAAMPVFEQWVTERYISSIPLAILAAALEIVAVVLLAVGLILDSISHHEKQKAELHLLAMSKPMQPSQAVKTMGNGKE